jgi:hypothetical protein
MLGSLVGKLSATVPAAHRLVRNYFMPVRVERVITEQLEKIGVPARHMPDFLRARRRGFSAQMAEDFWGDLWGAQAAQPFTSQVQHRLDALATVLPPGMVNMPDFTSFANELPKYNEVIRWVMYDNLVYPAAGTLDLLFFQNNQGAGRAVTNMQQGGALPGNQMLVVTSIGINPKPSPTDVASGAALAQWQAVLNTDSFYRVTISSKEYFSCNPIAFLPPGFGIGTVATGTAASLGPTHANSGSPDKKAAYVLDIPLGILPTRTFSGEAQWGTLRTVTTVAVMENFFDGYLLRAVQ